jgi:hypothetical protein
MKTKSYTINELFGIFQALGGRRGQKLKKQLKKHPKYKAIEKDLDKIEKDSYKVLQDYFVDVLGEPMSPELDRKIKDKIKRRMALARGD